MDIDRTLPGWDLLLGSAGAFVISYVMIQLIIRQEDIVRQDARIQQEGVLCPGVIERAVKTELPRDSSNRSRHVSYTYELEYSFADRSGAKQISRRKVEEQIYRNFPSGREIQVRYDPQNPALSVPDFPYWESVGWRASGLALIAGISLLAGGWMLLTAYRKIRNRLRTPSNNDALDHS